MYVYNALYRAGSKEDTKFVCVQHIRTCIYVRVANMTRLAIHIGKNDLGVHSLCVCMCMYVYTCIMLDR